MKRHGHLWESLISFPNLLDAAHDARKRKRYRPAMAQFFFHLEQELWQLHADLSDQSYQPGPYQTFYVHEPKKRLISAAPVRDRVVHHALTRILAPVFEPSFIADSYACRRGKGTHAAVRRAQGFARRFRYVLKADVRKFFPSLDHAILKTCWPARSRTQRSFGWQAGSSTAAIRRSRC
jgi:retron-type reverse transcriptase